MATAIVSLLYPASIAPLVSTQACMVHVTHVYWHCVSDLSHLLNQTSAFINSSNTPISIDALSPFPWVSFSFPLWHVCLPVKKWKENGTQDKGDKEPQLYQKMTPKWTPTSTNKRFQQNGQHVFYRCLIWSNLQPVRKLSVEAVFDSMAGSIWLLSNLHLSQNLLTTSSA